LSTESPIFIVSDSTGETAEKVVRASLLQFPQRRVPIRLFTRIRDEAALDGVLREASEKSALVVFTLVKPELREIFHRLTREREVQHFDVIGSLIGKIGLFLGADPLNRPTLDMPLTEDYFRRVEAIEFAVKSDDGKEPRNFARADLVLTGVSRTSKTPLSTYLAGRGLRVANIPLVLDVEPPKELEETSPHKVVGLTIDPDLLIRIRQHRLKQLGMPEDASYGLREHVRAELEYASGIFRRNPGWLIIDVTNRAIEETAAIILEATKARE
jgi:regulator of PEP synthase PpsR (kinase-PPPase family)